MKRSHTYRYTVGIFLLGLLALASVPVRAGDMWDNNDEDGDNALPDLIVSNNIEPLFTLENFDPTACAVADGCIIAGSRRLMRFSTSIINVGTADVTLGDPTQNSDVFTWNSCHGHYHRKDSVVATLLDVNNTQVTATTKIGFCLLDSWNALGTHQGKYNCNNQGLTIGWADVYGRQLDCQWVDITGVASGNYTLVITANANQAIEESDYDNNSVSVLVTIP